MREERRPSTADTSGYLMAPKDRRSGTTGISGHHGYQRSGPGPEQLRRRRRSKAWHRGPGPYLPKIEGLAPRVPHGSKPGATVPKPTPLAVRRGLDIHFSVSAPFQRLRGARPSIFVLKRCTLDSRTDHARPCALHRAPPREDNRDRVRVGRSAVDVPGTNTQIVPHPIGSRAHGQRRGKARLQIELAPGG